MAAACSEAIGGCRSLPLVILDARLGGSIDREVGGLRLAGPNLELALAVAERLQNWNVPVRLIRSTDCDFTASSLGAEYKDRVRSKMPGAPEQEVIDKCARIALANRCWEELNQQFSYLSEDEIKKRCILVSIGYMIKQTDPSSRGVATRYAGDSVYGAKLANAIHSRVFETVGGEEGPQASEDAIILYTAMPAVWVAPLQANNNEDRVLIQNPDTQTKIANAITRGILDYLTTESGEPPSDGGGTPGNGGGTPGDGGGTPGDGGGTPSNGGGEPGEGGGTAPSTSKWVLWALLGAFGAWVTYLILKRK